MPRSAPSAAGARPDGDRARHRARAFESPPARTGAILAADLLPRGASRRCRRLLRLARGEQGVLRQARPDLELPGPWSSMPGRPVAACRPPLVPAAPARAVLHTARPGGRRGQCATGPGSTRTTAASPASPAPARAANCSPAGRGELRHDPCQQRGNGPGHARGPVRRPWLLPHRSGRASRLPGPGHGLPVPSGSLPPSVPSGFRSPSCPLLCASPASRLVPGVPFAWPGTIHHMPPAGHRNGPKSRAGPGGGLQVRAEKF